MTNTDTLRILITKEGDGYVAEGLEVNIFTQASSIDELLEHFAITLEVNQGNERAMQQAPDHVFARWERAESQSIDDSIASKIDHKVETRFLMAA